MMKFKDIVIMIVVTIVVTFVTIYSHEAEASGMKFRPSTGGSGTPGGSSTQVQYNMNNVFSGDSGFIYTETSDTATVGTLIASGGANSQVTGGNGVSVNFDTANTATLSKNGGEDIRFNLAGGNVCSIDSSTGVVSIDTGVIFLKVGGSIPTSPSDGSIGYDSFQKSFKFGAAGNTQYAQGAIFVATADAVVNNTGALTMFGAGVGTTTLSANFFTVGKTIRVRGSGYLTTDGSAGNCTFLFKYGSTTVATSGNQAITNSLTNQYFEFDMIMTCRTTGATGTVYAQGQCTFNTAVATSSKIPLVSTAAVTIDTTASSAVGLTGNFDNSGNTLTITNSTVEVLN